MVINVASSSSSGGGRPGGLVAVVVDVAWLRWQGRRRQGVTVVNVVWSSAFDF